MRSNNVVGLISLDATWEAYVSPHCMLASPQEGMAVKASPTSSADDGMIPWEGAGALLPKRKSGSVTFSEKVHVYEFQRDVDAQHCDPCTDWLAKRLQEDKNMCQELEKQWRRELSDSEEKAKRAGGPYAGSLSWSAAARVEHMNMLPVQLVRVEQKKMDASLPLHSVKGQIYVRNLSFQKHVQVRYTIDGWKSCAEIDAHFQESVTPGDNGVDCFAFEFMVDTVGAVVADSGAVISSPPSQRPWAVFNPPGRSTSPDANGNSTSGDGRGDARSAATTRVCVLQLAVRFTVDGAQYWDNNQGANYSLVLRS